MKTVFSSIEKVCHVFNAQTQSSGRSGNVYFNDNKIWSYGPHFLAAEIHPNGAVLINSRRYSPSTGQHLNYIWGATSNRDRFEVPNPSDPKSLANLQYLEGRIIESFENLLGGRDTSWNKADLGNITAAVREFNKYCDVFSIRGRIQLSPEFCELLNEIKGYRDARYLLTQTPAALAKRSIEAAKRADEKERNRLENEAYEACKQAERKAVFEASIPVWLSGGALENTHWFHTPTPLLRIKGNIVETSHGAEVPLSEALDLIQAVKRGDDVKGKRVGAFTVDAVNGDVITIGCHEINLKHAGEILAGASVNNAIQLKRNA